jgi:hypothetical protein
VLVSGIQFSVAMKDLVRDSTIGQAINKLSSGRLLPYADQRPGYQIPDRYSRPSLGQETTTVGGVSPAKLEKALASDGLPSALRTSHPSSNVSTRTLAQEFPTAKVRSIEEGNPADEDDIAATKLPPDTIDPYLVGWDGPNDPDNPKYANIMDSHQCFADHFRHRNWSPFKKGFVAFSISLLTFSGQTALHPFSSRTDFRYPSLYWFGYIYQQRNRAHERIRNFTNNGNIGVDTLRYGLWHGAHDFDAFAGDASIGP